MDFPRRIYPLDPRKLTEEQIAVVFAMTSRDPRPFDEIAQVVTAEKAADFHERWVVGYGHASVAEHAILHMAVENISRLACDTLEDNRLASYTEKSSRYQVLTQGYYYTPPELNYHPRLRSLYVKTCDGLFGLYQRLLDGTQAYLGRVNPRREGEREGAYNLRIRREATDVCRFILPAATLTNVGVTINARSMEYAIRKLLASLLQEERELGEQLKIEGKKITPTLIKYVEPSPFLLESKGRKSPRRLRTPAPVKPEGEARLIRFDNEAEERVIAALLFLSSRRSYLESLKRAKAMGFRERERVLEKAWGSLGRVKPEGWQEDWGALGPFDTLGREAELPYYTFEFVLDYGAYREFKRHRMQTYLAQPLTTANGAVMPELIESAGLAEPYQEAIASAEEAFDRIGSDVSPTVAQYVVTHAHRRRVLSQMNLRECYHLFKLRTSPEAHFTLRRVMQQAMALAVERHPLLFRYLQLRSD